MKKESRNPNTPKLWDRLLFEKKKTLLGSEFYLGKIEKTIGFIRNHRGRFLDIGVGRGNLERQMVEEGVYMDIYGIDISPKTIRTIKKEIRGKFYVSSIYKLPFKSSFFNVAVILDVLEHIYEKDAYRSLKEVGRVLKKDGGLIISVPLNENLTQLNKEKRNFNRHLREYTPEILERELKISGFEVKDKKFIYAFRNFYGIKTFLMKFLPGFRKPNLLIVYCIKK